MKKLIIAAIAAAALGGCIAVPAPYYGDGGYYSAPPAVAVGVYAPPLYFGHGYRGHHHHRHHRRW